MKETLPLFRQRVRESTWVCAWLRDARSKDRQHLAYDKPIDPPCAVVAGWWPDACVRGGERDSAARSAFSASCLLSILQNVAPPCPQRRMYCQDNLRTISPSKMWPWVPLHRSERPAATFGGTVHWSRRRQGGLRNTPVSGEYHVDAARQRPRGAWCPWLPLHPGRERVDQLQQRDLQGHERRR